MQPTYIKDYEPHLKDRSGMYTEKELLLIADDGTQDGVFIEWSDGSVSFHSIYEPQNSFVFEDMVILTGHEELIFVRNKEEVLHKFTR